MSEEKYTMVRITITTANKLKELAENQKRSMSNQVEWLIENEHQKIFQVIDASSLSHPEGAEPVPLLTIEPV